MQSLFDQPEAKRDIELAYLQVGHSFSVIAINIQNPSLVRARAILDYLSGERHDVIVLTELTDKPAVRVLVDGLSALGYGATPLGQAAPKEYHTLIFSRFAFDTLPVATQSLRNRVKIIRLNTLPMSAPVYIVGVYGYSFNSNNQAKRVAFKADFEERILRRLQGQNKRVIVIGDLNVIETQFHDHLPEFCKEDKRHYQQFAEAGYVDIVRRRFTTEPQFTWYPPTGGLGQRLDHVFVAESLLSSVGNLSILHELRARQLTDHSGIAMELTIQPLDDVGAPSNR